MRQTNWTSIVLIVLISFALVACSWGDITHNTPSPNVTASAGPSIEPDGSVAPVSPSPNTDSSGDPVTQTPTPTESSGLIQSPGPTKAPDITDRPKPTQNGLAQTPGSSTTPSPSSTPTASPAPPKTPKPSDDIPEDNSIVNVTINRNKKIFTSNFKLGITHTQYRWEKGARQAVNSAQTIVNSFSSFNNQHIMGWGADNPWPRQEGPMHFSSLDTRIDLMRSLDGEPMITFCQAPGWMKGQDDWAMEVAVLDEYIDDFAYLCGQIAKRYPDVKYFQVWNEFKGYWSSQKNEWDYEGYTKMYNAVYTAVKQVRPDALVGGFYMVIEGDGSRELLGTYGTHDYTPLDSFQRRAIRYWLSNSAGADFICLDMGLLDHHNELRPTAEQTMVLTKNYANVVSGVAELTDLPIIMSEFYGHPIHPIDRALDAAQYAAMYKNMIMGSNGRELNALLWVEQENNLPGSVFSDTDVPGGGKAFKHTGVAQAIHRYFSIGHDIVEAYSPSDSIIVLASREKIMLVNAKESSMEVQINNGPKLKLGPFEVKFLNH